MLLALSCTTNMVELYHSQGIQVSCMNYESTMTRNHTINLMSRFLKFSEYYFHKIIIILD